MPLEIIEDHRNRKYYQAQGVGKKRKDDRAEARLSVWYGVEPAENSWDSLTQGITRAREMIQDTLTQLNMNPLPETTRDALDVHFNFNKLPERQRSKRLKNIRCYFEYMRDGLAKPVLCLTQEPPPGARATTKRFKAAKDENRKAVFKNRIFLNEARLRDNLNALARTIIHEASHCYASVTMPETDQELLKIDEIYAEDDWYEKQDTEDAIANCADSYAWTALSIYLGHVATPYNFGDGPRSGCDLKGHGNPEGEAGTPVIRGRCIPR